MQSTGCQEQILFTFGQGKLNKQLQMQVHQKNTPIQRKTHFRKLTEQKKIQKETKSIKFNQNHSLTISHEAKCDGRYGQLRGEEKDEENQQMKKSNIFGDMKKKEKEKSLPKVFRQKSLNPEKRASKRTNSARGNQKPVPLQQQLISDRQNRQEHNERIIERKSISQSGQRNKKIFAEWSVMQNNLQQKLKPFFNYESKENHRKNQSMCNMQNHKPQTVKILNVKKPIMISPRIFAKANKSRNKAILCSSVLANESYFTFGKEFCDFSKAQKGTQRKTSLQQDRIKLSKRYFFKKPDNQVNTTVQDLSIDEKIKSLKKIYC